MSDASDRAFIERAVRLGIIGLVAFAVLASVLYVLKGALTPLAVAWVVAYLLDPLIDRMEQRGIPRSAGILLLLIAAGGAMFATAFLLVPAMQREVSGLSRQLPGYIEGALSSLGPALEERFGISLPSTLHEGLTALRAGDMELPLEAARQVLDRTLRAITGTFGALVSLLIIPVLAYYLLVEFDRIRLAALELVPRSRQALVSGYAVRVDGLVSGFIRGQLSVCLVLAVLYGAGFAAIGIDLAFVIGALSGLMAIIPYVGGAVALASAAGMSILQFGFDVHLLLVVGWYALVQGLEGMVLTPRIVGQSLGMHPVVVIVALLIGGDLLGFLGLMIAVPAAAVAQVFLADLVGWYRDSSLYAGDATA